jgi:N-acetylglucosaminyl-diphospho-decaprenol L-rhamnosyltransferase
VTSPDALTTVVVDWNLPDYTVRCVESLVADGVAASRIVVVENGPTAENWSRISAELSRCVLVRIDANVGFAKANNIGARILPAQAYLLVNNDAFVHRAGSVSALLKALERPGIGIAVPRLLNADLTLQPSVAPFTTPVPALVRASGLSRFVPDRWQPRLSTHWSHARSREIEAAIGAVMLVDARAWERLGGLRESSFMYAEDLDLCWRAREAGWKNWFSGDAEFVHLGGASSDLRWSNRERSGRIARAEASMIREHLPPAKAAAALTFMRLGLAARVVWFSLVRNAPAAASCRGFLEGLGRARVEDQVGEVLAGPAIEVVQPRG